MKHLGYLKLLNTLMAGLFVFAGLLSALLVCVPLVLGLLQGGMGVSDIIVLALAGVVSFILCAALGVLYFITGRKVARGRGRVLQTITSILSMGSVPLGTAYAIYGLWVCWMNDETKVIFEEGGVLD